MNYRQKTYHIGIYEKAIPENYDIFDILAISKNAGYDFLEISIDRSDLRIGRLYDKSFQKKLSKASLETNLPIGSMCLSALSTYTLGNENPKIVEKALDIFYHAIDFAIQTGIRIIQIPACDVPKLEIHTNDTNTRFIHNLRRMVDYAASNEVLIGLENMEDDYMDTIEKCMRLINTIQSPFFQLYSDAGNITSASVIYGTKAIEDFELGYGHHLAFHLKETKPQKYGGLFYGEGHVNFEIMVKSAWKQGVRSFVNEYWFTGNPEWKKDLNKARVFTETCIENAIRNTKS